MSNIIFLDIDGVLTSNNSFVDGVLNIDRNCIDFFLDGLSEIENIKIVISSSWRKQGFNNFVEKIKKQVPERHEEFLSYLHQNWETPITHDNFRGSEINRWVENNPGFFKILCIDDGVDFFTHQKVLNVPSEYGFGLCERDLMVCFFNRDSERLKKYAKVFIEDKINILQKQIEFIKKNNF